MVISLDHQVLSPECGESSSKVMMYITMLPTSDFPQFHFLLWDSEVVMEARMVATAVRTCSFPEVSGNHLSCIIYFR